MSLPSEAQEPSSFASPKYWIGPYAATVSTLYLWGYWGSFDVNILEYISIADVIKAAIYPIMSAFAFFALGVIAGEVLSPNLNLTPGGGANTRVGKWLNRYGSTIAAVYVVGLTLLIVLGPIEKWRVLPVLISTAVYLPLKASGLLRNEFKADGARSAVIFLLSALVPFAYGKGVLKAHEILTGSAYTYVVSVLPSETLSIPEKTSERSRYVGKAGDRYVLYDPVGKSTLFIAAEGTVALTLKQSEVSPSRRATTEAALPRSSSTPAASAPANPAPPAKSAS